MKTLKTLIRVHEWQLEEKRRRVVELESLREALLQKLETLDQEIQREKQFVAAQIDDQYPRAALAFSHYISDARLRREDIVTELRFNGERIESAMKEVTLAYQDLKKYEIALEQRQKQLALVFAHKEQIRLDEIAIEGFRRRQ